MVAFLLDRGADPTKRDASGPNVYPLDWAIHNSHPTIFNYMLDRGGCVRDLDDHLRYAVQRSEVEIVRHLLKAGANPTVTCGREKESLIKVAERESDPVVVKILKEAVVAL